MIAIGLAKTGWGQRAWEPWRSREEMLDRRMRRCEGRWWGAVEPCQNQMLMPELRARSVEEDSLSNR